MANSVVWVDIPALDLDRAIKFYSAVFGTKLVKMDAGVCPLGFLPGQDGESSGCIFPAGEIEPSDQGVLVYLNCQGRLDEAEAAIEQAGGKIVQAKHQIGPHGYRVVFLDSEGNRLALHSM